MKKTRIDTRKTAVLVIDMQNALLKQTGAPDGLADMVNSKGIISNTAKVIDAARKAGVPVIYSVHIKRQDGRDSITTIADKPYARRFVAEGTSSAAIVDELKPVLGEPIIYKRRSDAFYGSDLELLLRCFGVDTVIVGGVVTNGCIAATVDAARCRDFHVIVLSDCCAAPVPEYDEYFLTMQFPLVARVRTSNEVVEAIREGGNNRAPA